MGITVETRAQRDCFSGALGTMFYQVADGAALTECTRIHIAYAIDACVSVHPLIGIPYSHSHSSCGVSRAMHSSSCPSQVDVSDIEAVVVRDSIWSAVRQFKLPNEGELLDELYAEFGDEPMDILLPKDQPRGSTRPPKSAPLFERGRSILRDIIAGFLISDDWAGWIESRNGSPDEEQAAQLDGFEAPHAYSARDSAVAEERDAAGKVEAVADEIENASPSTGSSTNVATWDGWD